MEKEVEFTFWRDIWTRNDLLATIAEQEWCANNLHRNKWQLVYYNNKRVLVFKDENSYFMFMLLGKKY